MEWLKVATVVGANGLLAMILMVWSGREGRAFRKSIKRTP